MRDDLGVLCCAAEPCEEQVVGPVSRLTAQAEAAGWQVAVPVSASADEDDLDLVTQDRCPAHQVDAMDLAYAAQELRVPLDMLTWLAAKRRA